MHASYGIDNSIDFRLGYLSLFPGTFPPVLVNRTKIETESIAAHNASYHTFFNGG